MNDFHNPEELVAKVEKELQSLGYTTAREQPFSGTIVSIKHYHKDERVQSLMIEINRWLYLAEDYSVNYLKGDRDADECVETRFGRKKNWLLVSRSELKDITTEYLKMVVRTIKLNQ